MSIAHYIDHTQLKADATSESIRRYCTEAKEYGFAAVCVNASALPLVVAELAGSPVRCCCVVGFPTGAVSTATKVFETREAVATGAHEIDMVINIGWAKEGLWEAVREEIREVVEAAKPALVKVIIETCMLNDTEKVKACQAIEAAGAAFVKTSTGFACGGATLGDIRLLKETVGDRLLIKASGGIRNPEFAEALIEAGADRLGAGNGIILLKKTAPSEEEAER